jgi:hypothetical protein
MSNYLVSWVIDIEDVNSPLEAAEEAFRIMQKSGTWANVFTVKDKKTNEEISVDLGTEDEDY